MQEGTIEWYEYEAREWQIDAEESEARAVRQAALGWRNSAQASREYAGAAWKRAIECRATAAQLRRQRHE